MLLSQEIRSMDSSRQNRFEEVARSLGQSFDGPIRIGGDYEPVVRYGHEVYVSGQIPRVGDQVLYVGRVGAEVSLDEARTAASISVMRALALLSRSLGGLDRVRKVLRMTVHIRCTADFTQLSEVSDGASGVLHRVLGTEGVHTRTSVGVLQLPKGASVELDLVVAAD